MEVIKDNMAHHQAVCPRCQSELEVTEADQHYNLFSYRKDLTCPCCGQEDSWDSFVMKKRRA